jgi:hypothetical protein
LLQLTQQARQLDDVDSDAPRFLARQPLGDTAPARLIVEIAIGERLSGRVYPDSKCGGRIMRTSEDYWRCADEARLLARQTKDLWEREALLRMAAQWERLAAHKANGNEKTPLTPAPHWRLCLAFIDGNAPNSTAPPNFNGFEQIGW